jgi:predicted ATP-dependent endonuclease of OLD family
MNFFRAEAERRQKDCTAPGVIYAVEEPETSQHPINQKMIIEALSELSQKGNCQVIITTHVPGLAGLAPIKSLKYVTKNKNDKSIVIEKDDKIYKDIANELGVLPDKRIQLLICVEGPHDVNFLTNISVILNKYNPKFPDLNSDIRIATIPLGGSTLKQWVHEYYTKNIGLSEVHIYDRDEATPPKYQRICDEVNARGQKCWATLTAKRELENYIHPDSIQEVFGVKLSFSDTDDVPKLLVEEINKDTTNPFCPINKERAKKILCERASTKMDYKRLCEIDKNCDIEKWFEKIASLLA